MTSHIFSHYEILPVTMVTVFPPAVSSDDREYLNVEPLHSQSESEFQFQMLWREFLPLWCVTQEVLVCASHVYIPSVWNQEVILITQMKTFLFFTSGGRNICVATREEFSDLNCFKKEPKGKKYFHISE